MPDDIRATQNDQNPTTGSGSGAAKDTGYGAGGLGAGGDRASGQTDAWDAPGVTPDGHRTGSSQDGPRTAMDGEAEPDADRFTDEDDQDED